jgi:tetratricopeptide (TPR) repeat protein
LEQNDYVTAKKHIDEAMSLNPQDLSVNEVNITFLRRTEQGDEELKALNKALDIFPTHSNFRFQKAERLAAMNKYDDALVILNKLEALHLKEYPFLLAKGVILGLVERFKEAEEYLQKAYLAPASPREKLSAKMAIRAIGPQLSQLCSISEDEYNSGLTDECLNGEFHLFVVLLERALEDFPTSNNLLHLKIVAVCSTTPGRQGYVDSQQTCDKLLELHPQLAESHLTKGVHLYQLGEHEKALKYLDSALQMDPNIQFANVWKARTHSWVIMKLL